MQFKFKETENKLITNTSGEYIPVACNGIDDYAGIVIVKDSEYHSAVEKAKQAREEGRSNKNTNKSKSLKHIGEIPYNIVEAVEAREPNFFNSKKNIRKFLSAHPEFKATETL